jgi:hypothetical protein
LYMLMCYPYWKCLKNIITFHLQPINGLWCNIIRVGWSGYGTVLHFVILKHYQSNYENCPCSLISHDSLWTLLYWSKTNKKNWWKQLQNKHVPIMCSHLQCFLFLEQRPVLRCDKRRGGNSFLNIH